MMKYLAIFLAAVLTEIASARMLESFENAAFPPVNWAKTNLLGGPGWYRLPVGVMPLPGWGNGTSSVPPVAGAGSHNAYCSWTTGGGSGEGYHNDQWLISPRLTGLTATSSVSYWIRFAFTNFPDTVYLRLSTNTAAPSDFTFVLQTNIFARGSHVNQFPPWTNVVVSLGGLGLPEGTPVYLAIQEYEWDNTHNGAAVQFDVIASDLTPPPAAQLSVGQLAFSGVYAGGVLTQTFALASIGGGDNAAYSCAVTYAPGGSGWAALSPAAGAVGLAESQVVTVRVSTATLNAGSYAATNWVTVPGSLQPPLALPLTLTLERASQAISFAAPGSQLTTSVVHLAATAGSGLPVVFTVDDGPATLSNGTNLSFYTAGTVRLVVSQAGNSNWFAAPSLTSTFAVALTPQSIAFPDPGPQLATSVVGVAATASSGLPVTFSWGEGAGYIQNATNLVFTGTGTVSVTAAQAGDGLRWSPAPIVTNTFLVSPAAAQVSLAGLAQTYDGSPRTVTATTTPEGLAVAITYAGDTKAPFNSGAYAVTGAVQHALYQGEATGLLVVARADQSILFPLPVDQPAVTSVVTLAAATSSDLPAVFTVVAGPGVLDRGTNLLFTGTGVVLVAAGQAGDGNFNPAPSVTNALLVLPPIAAITLENLRQVYDGTPRAVTAATQPAGVTVVLTYDGHPYPPVNAGTYAVRGQAADPLYVGESTGQLVVARADQAIAFAPLGDQSVSNVVSLHASVPSELPVSFAPLFGPAVMRDETHLFLVGTGQVSVLAWQAGDTNWNPAAPITNTFRVLPSSDPLPAPVAVAASQGTYSDRVRILWTAVPGAETYEIWRGNHADFQQAALLTNGLEAEMYDDRAVTMGPRFTYWIRACRYSAPGAFSEPATGFIRSAQTDSRFINDFTGDGISDLAVYQASSGQCFILGGDGALLAWGLPWGGPGYTPVRGDYNGDGLSDLAVYHEAGGCWFGRTCPPAADSLLFWAVPWGGPGFAPVSGDYDGDRVSDLAVYHSDSGLWYVRTAGPEILAWAVPLGGPDYEAIPGDYDADQATDLAVFDAATGTWYARPLRGEFVLWNTSWGGPGFMPVCGDYDGDGLSDLALYDPQTGAWYVRTVSGQILAWQVQFGGPGFAPVSGDFDGDGLSDLAVYDLAQGRWYARTIGGTVILWGMLWTGPGLAPL